MEVPNLGDFWQTALRQFQRLERDFALNPDLLQKYKVFIHVDLLPEQSPVYYISHDAVQQKFRFIFKALAPKSNGHLLDNVHNSALPPLVVLAIPSDTIGGRGGNISFFEQ